MIRLSSTDVKGLTFGGWERTIASTHRRRGGAVGSRAGWPPCLPWRGSPPRGTPVRAGPALAAPGWAPAPAAAVV